MKPWAADMSASPPPAVRSSAGVRPGSKPSALSPPPPHALDNSSNCVCLLFFIHFSAMLSCCRQMLAPIQRWVVLCVATQQHCPCLMSGNVSLFSEKTFYSSYTLFCTPRMPLFFPPFFSFHMSLISLRGSVAPTGPKYFVNILLSYEVDWIFLW